MTKLTSVASALISLLYLNGCNNYKADDSTLDSVEEEYGQTSALLTDYFDIEVGAEKGSYVIGKVQLRDNYKATFLGENFNNYSLNLINISGTPFKLKQVRENGRLEGIIEVSDNTYLNNVGEIPLFIQLLDDKQKVITTKQILVNVVDETVWTKYMEKLTEEVSHSERSWGKRYTEYGSVRPDADTLSVEEVLVLIENNQGKFTDLDIYNFDSLDEYSNYKDDDNGEKIEEAVARIGGLGYALKMLDPETEGYEVKRKRLTNAIVLAVTAYSNILPVKDFDDYKDLPYDDRTHQWRYIDALGLPLVLIADEIWKKADEGDVDAVAVTQAIYNIFQIAFSLPDSYRADFDYNPDLKLYQRYFLEKNLTKSPGGLNDANRGHRMRSWTAILGLWRDYNRPITDKKWWYDSYKPFKNLSCKTQGCNEVNLMPGWTPKGAFADLKFWIDTNQAKAYEYGQSGMLPDGTVSHHTGERQDLAMFAYGYVWNTEPLLYANLLKDTKWKIDPVAIDNSLEFLTKSMSKVMYKNGHDVQATGRSFMDANVTDFGTTKLAIDIKHLLELGEDEALIYKDSAEKLLKALESNTWELSENYGFWNSEFMVHRRGMNGEKPWYASWRSQSIRVRGAESFKKDPGFHNGSGVLQVKVSGDEYGTARYDFDWHIQPGVTEEWRTDSIPKQSKDDKKGLSVELYAGQNSNGRNGLASFDYSTHASYASAKAEKSAFFSDMGVVAVGDGIARDPKTYDADLSPYANEDPINHKAIVTTVDQTLWKDDLVFSDGTTQNTYVKGSSLNESKSFTKPIWLYQGNKGYIIWPDRGDDSSILRLIGGDQIQDSYSDIDTEDNVVAMVLDHGVNPDSNSDDYQYLILPNVTAAEMPALYNKFTADESHLEIVNTKDKSDDNKDRIYGAAWNIDGKKLIQLSFRDKAEVTLGDGLQVGVDKPALVMLTETDNGWQISVSDPTHHGDGVDPHSYSRFMAKMKPEANEIKVTINQDLVAGNYNYNTQGYSSEYVEGQNVSVTSNGSVSTLIISLPDYTDDKAYGLRTELFAGMSAVIEVAKK